MKLPIAIVGILVGTVLGIVSSVIYPLLGLLPLLLGICIGACVGGIAGIFTSKRLVIEEQSFRYLPKGTVEFITLVIKKMRYRKKIRAEVMDELVAHFEDELQSCKTDDEKKQKAQRLIDQFGDVKLLGILLRRAKKRCRPLWRIVVARTFQTVGVLILCFILYVVWFLTGKPTISVDYLEIWNEISKPEIIDGDNAWINYGKAMELYVEPNEVLQKIIRQDFMRYSDLDEPEQRQVVEWIEKNQAAWEEFVKGSLCPYYYRKAICGGDPNDPYHNWLLGVLLPHLRPLRDLGRLGIWRSKIGLESGKIEQSLEDSLTVIRAGSHIQDKGGMIEQLVGIAITKLGCNEILGTVFERQLSTAMVAKLQRKLQEVYREGYPETDIESERLLFLDTVQQVFTDGGPGGGHLVPRQLSFIRDSVPLFDIDKDYPGYPDQWLQAFKAIAYTTAGIAHARRDEIIAKGNEIYDKLSEIVKMSPYQRDINNLHSEDIIYSLPAHRYFLIHYLTPATDRVSEIRYQSKALYEATVTVLALKRWRLENNGYPADLDELVRAGYLKQLPMDPYSDKPLVYRKAEDHFTLYSVGRNFKDDGGLRYSEYPWGSFDKGDRVFWPIENFDEREKRLEKESRERLEEERKERQQRLERYKSKK